MYSVNFMESYHLIVYCAILLFSYLLGSVPWGLVFTRLFTDIDILKEGSGNIGATNVRRLAGNGLGLLTLLADFLKGAVPVLCAAFIGGRAGEASSVVQVMAALAAFTGHLFPVYSGFKNGGKGVATAAGGLAALSPIAFVATLVIFALFIWRSRRVSVGSLAAAATMPVAVWATTGSVWTVVIILVMAILIIYRHRENIRRIRAGTEPKI